MMLYARFCSALIVVSLSYLASATPTQEPLSGARPGGYGFQQSGNGVTHKNAKRVAIVGAGLAGSSCAYHMRGLTSDQVPIEITIFERADRVGGRAKLAHVDDELTFGLEEATHVRRNEDIGVWDGSKLVFYQRWQSPAWRKRAELFWKYGLTPFRTQALAKKDIDELRANFEINNSSPEFHFKTVHHANIEKALSTTAEAYLEKHNILPPYSTEIIQANTRKRYAQNLATVHGLAAMMAMNTEYTTSVKGGNWRLFDAMVNASKAHLNLNSRVTQIIRHDNGTFSIEWQSSGTTVGAIEHHVADFDTVIVAVPAPSTSVNIQPPLDILPRDPRYVKRHVTHFVTPELLNPALFDLPRDAFPPNDLRTTLNASDASDPGLFQITVPQRVIRPFYWEAKLERVYKIITPSHLNDTTIAHLLGLRHEGGTLLDDSDVHWVHRQAWPHAYPQLPPKTAADFHPISPTRNLYFSSEIESIESSLEMSSLMGRNIARIAFRDWIDGYGKTN